MIPKVRSQHPSVPPRTISFSSPAVRSFVRMLHTRLSSPAKKSRIPKARMAEFGPDIGFNILLTASARSPIIFRPFRRAYRSRGDMKTVGAYRPRGDVPYVVLCNASPPIFRRAHEPRGTRDQRCHSPLQ